MRFYPSNFTGDAPRKGMRIPLNKIKYNEQRDEETGYGYFGARYMDHELMTGWLSVDPMADKYPSVSPYAYCAWNPVKLVDPDGRDVEIVKDDQKKTVTIRANFYYSKKDIGEDADVFIKGFHAALESWQKDIKEALNDGSLGAVGYEVTFEFDITECNNPQFRAENDGRGNWIANNENISSGIESQVRGSKNLQVDFSKNVFSNIDGNPLFYGNGEYQGTLKHEIGHLFGLYDRYNNGGTYATPIFRDLMSIDIPRNNAEEPFKRIWKSAGLDQPGSKTVIINKKNREVKN